MNTDPLLTLSIQESLKRAGKYFENALNTHNTSARIELPCPLIQSEGELNIQDYIRENKLNKIVFPYMSARIDRLAVSNNDETPYNVGTLYRMRRHTPTDVSPLLNKAIRTVPVTLDLTINFNTDDFWQAFNYVTAWIHAAQNKSFVSFDITMEGIPYTVKQILVAEVSMPVRNEALTEVNMYLVQGQIRLQTYSNLNLDYSAGENTSASLVKLNVTVGGDSIEDTPIILEK